MKKSVKLYRILFILILINVSACELISDKNDDCDATKMEKTEEPIINIRAFIPIEPYIINNYTPEKIIVTGNIRKIYCSGKESGNFSYNPTFLVDDQTSFYENMTVLTFPQLYQYKFDNTRDKLIVMCSVKIYNEDGSVFESGEILQEFFYKDVVYVATEMMSYIALNPKTLDWYEVTL